MAGLRRVRYFADRGGAANEDATLVRRLQHAIPSARLSSSAGQAITRTRFCSRMALCIRHDNFSLFSSCTISYVPSYLLNLNTHFL